MALNAETPLTVPVVASGGDSIHMLAENILTVPATASGGDSIGLGDALEEVQVQQAMDASLQPHTNKPSANILNFQDIRSTRQQQNNITVYANIKNGEKDKFYKNINTKELERMLTEEEWTFEEFWAHAQKDDMFCKMSARLLSKCASRQGSKDEYVQLEVCGTTSEKCGVNIKNLSATALRPTKDGKIITQQDMKTQKIKKDCCLKSFDGSIQGKMTGYISAKVAFGSGGHQDNVFEEIDTVAEWWKTYKSAETQEFLVLLIDTNLEEKFARIKEKYDQVENILVFNHREFQEYIIERYYPSESE
tara:strand:+ start:904 stop:1821 length:918 start_codon:yes stop_codon:yes gene_type:complete